MRWVGPTFSYILNFNKMKEYQKVLDFLDKYQGWKIRRVALVNAIHRWENRECSFRISKGPSRSIIMKCLFHNEKTPSMHMYINGNIYCYGCGKDLTWLDLILELYKPYDVDDLLSVAKQFVYSKTDGVKTQLLFKFT